MRLITQFIPCRVIMGSIFKLYIGIMEVRDNFFYSLYMMWLEVGMYYVELILIFGCGISQQRMESNTGCKYIITVECKEYRYWKDNR